MATPKLAVHLLMGLTMLIWGIAYTPIAWALEDVSALELAVWRHVVAGAVFLGLLALKPAYRARPERRDLPMLAAIGVLVVIVYHLALYTGQEEIPPGTAGLLVSSVPAMTAALSFAVLRERMPPRKLVGLATAFAGVAVVLALGTPGREASLQVASLGALVLVAPLSTALATVFGKPLALRYGGPRVAALTTLLGTALLLPWGLPLAAGAAAKLSPLGWASVLYLGVLSTALAFVLYFWALQRLTPTETSVYILLMPISAVLFGALAYGTPLTAFVALGGALVLLGVALTNLSGATAWRRAPRPAAPAEAPPPAGPEG